MRVGALTVSLSRNAGGMFSSVQEMSRALDTSAEADVAVLGL